MKHMYMHTFMHEMPTTIIFFLLPAAILFFKFRFQPKTKWRQLPPGPKPWPIVGSLPELVRNKPVFRWILDLMKKMNTDIACFRLGNVHVITVTCPEIAREFLKKQDSIIASRPITMATEYYSRGFLSVATVPWGEQWKKMRRVLSTEVLSPARFRWLHDKRVEEADNIVYYVYNQCKSSKISGDNKRVVDVRYVVRHYAGNASRKMVFNKRYFGKGRDDGGAGKEEEQHLNALWTILNFFYVFCVSDYIPWLRCLDLEGHENIVKQASMVADKYNDPIIEERIKEWRSGKKKDVEDILDILISVKDSNGNPLLSSEEIKAAVGDLMCASIDNPANAVEWAMAEMMNQPNILEKAVEEIDRVVGKERLVQESDFDQLNYVKACLREAFRLHPVAPFNLPHVSNADLTVAGYLIPKGSHVLLSRVGLGRNPKVWNEPLKFKPERHLNEHGGSSKVDLTETELRFISFSRGRRGCIGVTLGSSMTVMLLARLLQAFTWSFPSGISNIDLSESKNDLFLAKPLHALAKPRLSAQVYPTF